MQAERPLGELSFKQLKQRQISEQYLKLEENTEVLTQIFRYNSRTRKNPLKISMPIDMKSIIGLIVQKSYLLYTCLLRKTNILLSVDLYARPPRRGQFNAPQEAYCEYLLNIEKESYPQEEQQALGKKFKFIDIHNSPHGYGDCICRFILNIRKKLAHQFDRLKTTQEGYIMLRQVDALAGMVESFLAPQVQRLEPKALILALQQTEIFREHSLLLKCLNCSLFSAIRFSPNYSLVVQELLQLQSNLLAQSKRDQQQSARRIQISIQESVRLLLKHNVVFSEQSISENSKKETQPNPNNTQKPYIMGDVDGAHDSRRYFIKLFVRERPLRQFNAELLQGILGRREQVLAYEVAQQLQGNKQGKQKQKEKALARGEYLVQFWAGKNLLCVRYVTSIELNVQNTDILMFHCNYLTYSWNNITLQFVEKTSGKSKRKERFLTFKAISYIHFQEKVIFKIFTMIDLLMVYAKIAEPHLKKNILNIDEYYLKTGQLSAHCDHIKRAFIRKVEKNYQAIQEKHANRNN